MDQCATDISYQRLPDVRTSTRDVKNTLELPSPSPPVSSSASSELRCNCTEESSKSSLPTPALIKDLHDKAQVSQAATLSLLTQYLPNDIGINQQHYPSEFFNNPSVLLPHESSYDQTCSTHLLGSGKSLFKYNRFKSGLHTHRFMCTKLSISSSDKSSILFHCNWPIVRQACLLAFFTCFAGILCILIGLLISSPLVPCEEEYKWFQGAIFYEIFPASFQDSDGDGYGDFNGITRRLDYIQKLGVRAIRLNSVFSALDYPLEYEHIIDLRNVDPHLGRLRDFEHLVKECHYRGIRIILDINPTVTSDQHTWALHWQRGIEGYQNFYASANRSKAPPEMEDNYGPPPEDWELNQRTFGGHYIVNWSNPLVRKEYRRTLSFWIQLGVDGFYMKHLEKLHVRSTDDIYVIVQKWREELDRFHLWSSNRNRILITSLKFADHIQKKISNYATILNMFDLIDVPLYLRQNASSSLLKQISVMETTKWRSKFESPWIMWHFGSADTFRFASRINRDRREAAFHILAMLPGSVSIFYGDEIGLTDSYNAITGNVYRGGQFSPMLWTSNNTTADFTNSTTEPWLPLIPDHQYINVATQSELLNSLVKLTRIRSTRLQNRNYKILDLGNNNVFALERQDNNILEHAEYTLIVNFGRFLPYNVTKFLKEGHVLVTTKGNFGKQWLFSNFTLYDGESLVVEKLYKTQEFQNQ